jgi:hypothetical protein
MSFGVDGEEKAMEHTSDDIHKFVGDSGLSSTIVFHLEGTNHV